MFKDIVRKKRNQETYFTNQNEGQKEYWYERIKNYHFMLKDVNSSAVPWTQMDKMRYKKQMLNINFKLANVNNPV